MTLATSTIYEVPRRPGQLGRHEQILTVGELIGILAECNEDDQVLIGAQCIGGEWLNICQVIMPDDDEGYLGLTLIATDTFDPRQF
jgi:hypothetical protein